MCAYTNTAVDNLVDSFSAAGVKPLRVGFAGRVPHHLHQFTLDAQIDAHSLKPTLDQLRSKITTTERQLDKLETSIENTQDKDQKQSLRLKRGKLAGLASDSPLNFHSPDTLTTSLGQLRRRRWGKEREMLTEIVSRADVVSANVPSFQSSH